MTWVVFERGAKFLVAMVWATWELMVRHEPDVARLAFIATVLSASEAVRVVAKARQEVNHRD